MSALLGLPLAVGRFLAGLCLYALRVLVAFAVMGAVLYLVVSLGIGGLSKDDLSLDPDHYLENLRRSTDWAGWSARLTPTAPETGSAAQGDITTGNPVGTISEVLSTEKRPAYQEAIPLFGEYDSLLDGIRSAIDQSAVDDMFNNIQAWLDMAEKDAARYQTPSISSGWPRSNGGVPIP